MATTKVSIEEYLRTSYRPDVEYIDGELRSRSGLPFESKQVPMVQFAHGRLQWLICSWFDRHEELWNITGGVETRIQVSPDRVRLPDVVIDHAGAKPDILVEPPLIVVEVLSPDDSYAETQRRAADYRDMGIENIWLIDPETRTGRICKGRDRIAVKRFTVAGSPIYMDLDELFVRLDKTARPKSSAVPTSLAGTAPD